MSSEACRISLDQFEGPLDLLLYLIKRDELDIREVAVARVAEQYLSYIREAEELDLDIASEYLVMAATLTSIKSRALLPSRASAPEEDPGRALMRQLILYRAFREVATELRANEDIWRNAFPSSGERQRWSADALPAAVPGDVSILDLLQALDSLSVEKPEPVHRFRRPELTIAECVEMIAGRLRHGRRTSLRELLGATVDRRMIVAFFVTLLELSRQGLVTFSQPLPFGELMLARAGEWG
jgi:segregation and condensation protein A